MTTKRYLTRGEILAADDLKVEEVHVPEWGEDVWVRVRTLKASERDYFESTTLRQNGREVSTNLQNIRSRLCLLCIVDETGERIFQEEDEYPLGGKSAAALSRIFDVAQRLNGFTKNDVEELAKNSSADQSDDSPSS